MKIISLFILLLSSVSAFALNDSGNCELSGVIVLNAPTTYLCTQDLNVAKDTKIITNGYPLEFLVAETANFANLTITSYPETTPAGFEAAPIYLYARIATGNLTIRNYGSSPADMSGDVKIEYTSAPGYEHDIGVSETTVVDVMLNGIPYFASAPTYKLTTAVPKI